MNTISLQCSLSRLLIRTTFACIVGLMVLLEGSFLSPSAAQFDTEVAPDFEVRTFDGEYFSNFDLEGEQALLMFWAPWCGVCKRELPRLARYYEEDMPYDLQVLTIGTSASRGEVEEYVNGRPGTFVFPTAYDANKSMAEDFGIRAFPTYALLDRNGTILLVHRGGGIMNDDEFHQLTQ
jgi:thiol-disulfide isomerase/thioredoxin